MEIKPLIIKFEEKLNENKELVQKINNHKKAVEFLYSLENAIKSFDDVEKTKTSYFNLGDVLSKKLNSDLYSFISSADESAREAKSKLSFAKKKLIDELYGLANQISQEQYNIFSAFLEDPKYHNNTMLDSAIHSNIYFTDLFLKAHNEIVVDGKPLSEFEDLAELIELEKFQPDNTATYREIYQCELFQQAENLENLISLYKENMQL